MEEKEKLILTVTVKKIDPDTDEYGKALHAALEACDGGDEDEDEDREIDYGRRTTSS